MLDRFRAPQLTVSHRLASVAVAGAFVAFVVTSVYNSIGHIRSKLVNEPVAASAGRVVIPAIDPLVDGLTAPWALIARINNAGPTPQRFQIVVDGQVACEQVVAPGDSGRIDCAVTHGWRDVPGARAIAVIGDGPWTLDYLEIATHYGNTTGLLTSYVIPVGATAFGRPSSLWGLATVVVVVALLLFRPTRDRPGAIHAASRVVAAVSLGVVAIVIVAPWVSRYRLVVSAESVVSWLAASVVLRWWPTALLTRLRVTIPQAAWLVTVGLFVLTVFNGTRALGGSDSYGYVSEAELWLRGDLKIPQAFAADAPWPNADRAFAPLGYRPSPVDNRVIVPTYAPGLPLLLALMKLLGGHTAMYFVVPLFAGTLVLATFGLGRRLSSDTAGFIGAVLVATSPVVLTYSLVAMTDVPVATSWAVAFYVALGRLRVANASAAGLVAGLAVLIRPNLAPLAAILGLYYAMRVWSPSERRQGLALSFAYGIGVLPSVIVVAWVNDHLYGSPFTSGYGALGDLFAWHRMGANARNYFTWLMESQTPAVLIGAAAIAVPLRAVWPRVQDRRVFFVIGAFILALWGIYLAWEVFDTWLFLRFLIPSWPFFMVGIGAVAAACMERRWYLARPVAIGAVAALVLLQIRLSDERKVLNDGWAEDRNVAIARFVQRMTPPNGVIVCLHHSGSLRYYGGRTTIYFPWLDEQSLDTAVEWLAQRGVPTYALIEDWEMAEFRTRYASQRRRSVVDEPPMATFREPGEARLFDLSGSGQSSTTPVVAVGAPHFWVAPPPVPLAPLHLETPSASRDGALLSTERPTSPAGPS